MNHSLIIQPMLALCFLTTVVWIYMYIRRIHYIVNNNITPEQLRTPEQFNQVVPEHINRASNNLKNLFELPIIFYVACIIILLTDNVDTMFITAAWFYVFFRTIHSIIHCSINNIMWRFYVYLLSSLVLWAMIMRLLLIFY